MEEIIMRSGTNGCLRISRRSLVSHFTNCSFSVARHFLVGSLMKINPKQTSILLPFVLERMGHRDPEIEWEHS
jgi:hypothetical protein